MLVVGEGGEGDGEGHGSEVHEIFDLNMIKYVFKSETWGWWWLLGLLVVVVGFGGGCWWWLLVRVVEVMVRVMAARVMQFST